MSPRDAVHKVLEEHRMLNATIHRIEVALDRLLENPTAPDETWELPDLVRTLRDSLRSHFDLEEHRGPFGEAAACPDEQVRASVVQLITEHRAFEKAIERLEAELGCGFVPGGTVQECFDGEFRKLISDLAHHEAAENVMFKQLLQAQDALQEEPPRR